MELSTVKFNKLNQPEFFKELRKRVNSYFEENHISKKANLNMRVKTIFMISLYFIPFAIMLSGLISSPSLLMLMWVLMGFGMSGIGLSIMHDANHGAYSKNKTVNSILGYLINFVGAYHINWKIQHNVLHHSFTNIEGLDGDIENPVMRFSPNQKRKKIHRFQIFYAPFLYAIMTLNWLFTADFTRLQEYNKRNLLAGQGLTFKKALVKLISNKIWYIVLTLVLPLVLVNLPWWLTVSGFLLMHFICGLALTLIFQPAHVIEETEFYTPDNEGEMENSWAIHQMNTTANFAHGNRIFSWFIGGLNYQIEHHLFPNICHVHYRNISKIVKETANEFNVIYHQHKTFFGALKSHFTLLNELGTGVYDKKVAH